MAEVRVETTLGTLIAKPSNDPAYPGIWIDLRRSDFDYDLGLVLVECDNGELITRVYGDATNYDYTDRIVHNRIEDAFKTMEDNE